MSWVNWQDFAGSNAAELQRQADETEATHRAQREQIDAALNGLDARAMGLARDGNFRGLDSVAGYSDLMSQRDAALKVGKPQQQVSPWESELQRPETSASPWSELNKRLGTMNQKAAERSQGAQRQAALDAQRKAQQEFQKAQEQKLKDANAGKDKATQDYIAWSDAVQNSGSHYRGSPGAGAYYDAAQGYGPQPVQQPWGNSPRVQKMQKQLNDINQNQIMPKDNRGFGNQPPGSNGWW